MFVLTLHERFDLLNTPKLAEAKPVAVDLKNVGSYTPSNPSLNILDGNTNTNSVVRANTKPLSPNNSLLAANSNSKSLKAESALDNRPLLSEIATNANTDGSVGIDKNSLNTKVTNTSQVGNFKFKITSQYNSTLIDFEKQTQWQVKGLQGSNTTWTVHLLDASGVFIRSRLNRGIAVLHRDAPSNIETFNIQLYNWGLLVSEFTVDRKQWMLSETQLLPTSQRFPAITTFDTATLPADGGNPFFKKSSSSFNTLKPQVASKLSAGEEPILEDELKHEAFKTNLGVAYTQIVGSPSSPYLFSLGVRGDAVYKFRENTWVTGTVYTRAVDNFGKYNYDPPPTGLQPVRTNIRQYMTQSIATMPNLQATNTGKLADNHFVSAYAGYLETMFAGAGGEYLWRPTNSRFAVGVDANRVRQRQFNVWTSMQNYAVTTGHLTTYWDTGIQDILVKASYGKYLAGDVGGTLDLSRVFQNGVKVGAYATRTNVDYAQFGEGSFDKGVYVSIPFDAFFARHSDSSANLLFTPLIRDGGAMLIRKYKLYDMTRTRNPSVLSTGPD